MPNTPTSETSVSKAPVSDTNDPKELSATAVRILKSHSPTAKKLLTWAKESNLTVALSDDLPSGAGGAYRRNGINTYIAMNHQNDLPTILASLPHEIMHAVQDEIFQGTAFSQKPNWGLKTRTLQTLCFEAAAFTIHTRVAFELKENGHPDTWHMLKEMPPLADVFEHEAEKHRQQGLDDHAALKKADEMCFKAFITSSPDRDYYLNTSLDSYANDLLAGNLTPAICDDLDTKTLLQYTIYGYEHETQTHQFLANSLEISLSDQAIFQNERLQHAVNFLEALRKTITRDLSKDSIEYKTIFEKLEQDDNPFAHIDTKKLSEKFLIRGRKNIFALMSEMAGLNQQAQYQMPLNLSQSTSLRPKQNEMF